MGAEIGAQVHACVGQSEDKGAGVKRTLRPSSTPLVPVVGTGAVEITLCLLGVANKHVAMLTNQPTSPAQAQCMLYSEACSGMASRQLHLQAIPRYTLPLTARRNDRSVRTSSMGLRWMPIHMPLRNTCSTWCYTHEHATFFTTSTYSDSEGL